jgi:RNA recognition motif-containing protein
MTTTMIVSAATIQQQQQPNTAHNSLNNSSTNSPLSNSSTNSSTSCLTTSSFNSSTPQSYSPTQQNQIILTIPVQNSAVLPQQQQQQQPHQQLDNNNLIVKKVKTHQKSQPSKVVHIRNIPPQLTEIEVIQFGLLFGSIANVLNLRSKCQAFLEFEKCDEAQSMVNYFLNNPIQSLGRQIFVQYSNYKNLVTDPSNTNNQVARAALDLAKELHKSAQTGGPQTVLRAMIQNMLYPVTLDTIYQIFSKYGHVLKIITFTKNEKFQALIQMKDAPSAQAAKQGLHGHSIFSNSCCTLHIDYSKLNTLNVKYNNEKSRDYTNPLLPAGDLPEHLTLGPGGIQLAAMMPHHLTPPPPPPPHGLGMPMPINAATGYPIQLTHHQLAAAGYHFAPITISGPPPTTTGPPNHIQATGPNPYFQFAAGKYLRNFCFVFMSNQPNRIFIF